MVKSPPCSQYEPPAHSIMTSRLGLQFCRKSRQPGTKKKSPKKQRTPPKPKPKAKRTPPKPLSPNKNNQNINYLRLLLRNIPAVGVNRVSRMLLNKARHEGAYKTKKQINNNIKEAAKVGFLPKQTLNQVRATRLEAIKAAQMARRRMGLPAINR